MYDVHVGDVFKSEKDKHVTVVQIDIDGRIRYEFIESRVTRWADREDFLERFPIVVHDDV